VYVGGGKGPIKMKKKAWEKRKSPERQIRSQRRKKRPSTQNYTEASLTEGQSFPGEKRIMKAEGYEEGRENFTFSARPRFLPKGETQCKRRGHFGKGGKLISGRWDESFWAK